MAEVARESTSRARMIFIVLLLANVLFFAYASVAPNDPSAASTRVEELQINPGRIKLGGSAVRGPAGHGAGAPDGKNAAYRACLEWGPFAASDLGRADSALARLALAQPPVQRPIADAGASKRYAYYVREPDAGAVAQFTELQRGFPGTSIKAAPCPFN